MHQIVHYLCMCVCVFVQELATHCRRETCGAMETEVLIDQLLTALKGSGGEDKRGVPLFDAEKLASTWKRLRVHVLCIQDPPGIPLYQRVGTRLRGGTDLPVYRCARGSTSLESFHLHLNRFVPGENSSQKTSTKRYFFLGLTCHV